MWIYIGLYLVFGVFLLLLKEKKIKSGIEEIKKDEDIFFYEMIYLAAVVACVLFVIYWPLFLIPPIKRVK